MFKHERPGHSSPLYLPVSVSISTGNPVGFPLRVLMTVAETRPEYTLSFDAEIPDVLDLDSETKWSQVDARLTEATLWKSLFAKFPQKLNTSLKHWRDLDSERQLQDVLSFLEDKKAVIPSHLRGSFLAIGTEQAARDNEHSICAPDQCNTFSRAQVRQLDPHRGTTRSYC